MILVTGAAGKTGRAIIRSLRKKDEKVRALIHRKEQEGVVRYEGASEVTVGNMDDKTTWSSVTQGADAVYHISPNVNPNEFLFGRLAIAAAENAGVERFVYHSVLHPQTEAMPHHWQKLRVEEALFEARLDFTILQPEAYMQNVLVYWPAITEEGVYAVPYPVSTKLGAVDLEDVAQVASMVLTESGHANTTYELAGPETLSPAVTSSIISREIGSEVRPKQILLTEWRLAAKANGLNSYQIDTLERMFSYYERYGFRGNENVLTWLLDRRPTDFTTFIKRFIANNSD